MGEYSNNVTQFSKLERISKLLDICNMSENDSFYSNVTNSTGARPTYLIVLPYVMSICYILIFAFGLIGNGLVIYVVLVFAKMKTVTNMYILNLALSDVMFLITLPLSATTTLVEHWIFGLAMCKMFMVLYSINLFTGAFNLCVMSADRYLAVCHPIRSVKYRTSRIALFLCLCIWSLSFLVVLPVILYTTTIPHRKFGGKCTCILNWPSGQAIPPDKAFIWYSFILGFALPISLISAFYVLVIVRLRYVGSNKKSKEKKRSHRRVTRLVLAVISIYIVCWLPYWCFQVHIVFNDIKIQNVEMVLLMNVFTILSFGNSMLNPFLYAFISDNFRKSFAKAFQCLSSPETKRTIGNDNCITPRTSHTCTRSAVSGTTEDKMELTVLDTHSTANQGQASERECPKALQDEFGFLKPPGPLQL